MADEAHRLCETRREHTLLFLSAAQVLEDVTGEEFVLLMRVVSGLRVLQTVNGRQQLVELVVEQAFLEQALNPADPDTVDRLLQCTRQALPLFSVSAFSVLCFFLVLFCFFFFIFPTYSETLNGQKFF